MKNTYLSDLTVGQRAIIEGFENEELSLKLLEMGCLPKSVIELTQKAPLGCPICIQLNGYQLALRKKEAATIKVTIIGK
jgi:ferrous iron transport protein A